MKLGVLHSYKRQYPPQVSVRMAVRNFENAAHCGIAGHFPAEVHFHPADQPADYEIDGLTVVADTLVRPGFVRVTTCEMLFDVDVAA